MLKQASSEIFNIGNSILKLKGRLTLINHYLYPNPVQRINNGKKNINRNKCIGINCIPNSQNQWINSLTLIKKTVTKPLLTNDIVINYLKYSTNPCKPQAPAPAVSPGRHCYHEDTEAAVNEQITAELNASFMYLSMASYFGRTEVALPGSYGYFMSLHREEHCHALDFMTYQLMRGGYVHLCPIEIPENQDWGDIQNALTAGLEAEKKNKEKLTALHDIGEKHHDLSVMELITTKYITEQEQAISEMARLLLRVTNMGNDGVALYLFDKELYKTFVKKRTEPLCKRDRYI